MKTLVSIAPCRLNRDRPVGFTLVELLVVIVIISVLAALLLPALGKSLAHAHKIQCLSELHQWGLAFNMYVNDNEDRIPREGYDPNGGVIWNTWVQVRRVEDTWYNGLPPYMSKPAASNYVLPSKRAGFYEKGSFFQCPSAKFPSDVHDPAYQIAIFSRAMNSQLIEPPNFNRETGTISIHRIKDESRTVLFLDNRLSPETKVVPEQDDKFLGQPSAYANRFAGRRHLMGGNLLFIDGHGKWFLGEDVVETQGPNRGSMIVPPKNIVWEPDPD